MFIGPHFGVWEHFFFFFFLRTPPYGISQNLCEISQNFCGILQKYIRCFFFFIVFFFPLLFFPMSPGGLRTTPVLSVHLFLPNLNWNALRTQTKYNECGYWSTALLYHRRDCSPTRLQQNFWWRRYRVWTRNHKLNYDLFFCFISHFKDAFTEEK